MLLNVDINRHIETGSVKASPFQITSDSLEILVINGSMSKNSKINTPNLKYFRLSGYGQEVRSTDVNAFIKRFKNLETLRLDNIAFTNGRLTLKHNTIRELCISYNRGFELDYCDLSGMCNLKFVETNVQFIEDTWNQLNNNIVHKQ